ncbi:hypothetical protein GW17_00049663, partial [Ensete ventricosum]
MSSGWLRLRTDRDNEKQRKRVGRLLRQGRRWLAVSGNGSSWGGRRRLQRRVRLRRRKAAMAGRGNDWHRGYRGQKGGNPTGEAEASMLAVRWATE